MMDLEDRVPTLEDLRNFTNKEHIEWLEDGINRLQMIEQLTGIDTSVTAARLADGLAKRKALLRVM